LTSAPAITTILLLGADCPSPGMRATDQHKAEDTMPPGYASRDDRRGIVRVAA